MIPVILSGGSGTRLWPVSRRNLPKQFSPLFSENLFANTVKRLNALGKPLICTGEAYRTLTEKNIRSQNLEIAEALFEPCPRNTAPAVAWICHHLASQGHNDEVVGIFPADHMVKNQESFVQVMKLAETVAKTGQIVTLGIEPSYPATGFGYIEVADQTVASLDSLSAYSVLAFHEKPKKDIATKYIQAGSFHWNSGMFVFKISRMIDEFKSQLPDLWNQICEIQQDQSNLEKIFQNLPSESLDYGIMEKAKNQSCVPCSIGWSDLGSWNDIETYQNENRNECQRDDIVNFNSENNFAFSLDKKLICLNGVNDIQVIDTPDVLYVGHKHQSQKIKELLPLIKGQHSEVLNDHLFVHRPWGIYKNLLETSQFKVKEISVDPGQKISYQMHNKRSETWIIVEGRGEVTLDDKVEKISVGSVIRIPLKAKHRIHNTGKEILKFVEVQLGEYFGEDDIQRFQDDYNRA